MHSLFFELFDGLPRQGPGDAASTRRALSFVPELTSQSRILDIGSGTGTQTFVLAESTPSTIVAIDNHVPYVDALNEKATELGVTDRVVAHVADMRQLDFAHASFDLIWCEGAIYNIGVAKALLNWRRFLRKDGFIAFTEVCWQEVDPPHECISFWETEYSAICSCAVLKTVIETYACEVITHFPLPASAWWNEYYRPLQDNINTFRARHKHDSEAQELCNQCQREIDIWHAYAAFYGYEFFVLRTV